MHSQIGYLAGCVLEVYLLLDQGTVIKGDGFKLNPDEITVKVKGEERASSWRGDCSVSARVSSPRLNTILESLSWGRIILQQHM